MPRLGQQASPPEREIFVSLVAADALAFAGTWLMPVLLGSLIDGLGLDPAQAGAVGSAELLTMAATAFLIAQRVSLISRHALAITGAVIVLTGNTASSLVDSWQLLLVARAVAGLGSGLLVAASNSAIAALPDPDRVFARLVIAVGLIGACLLALAPWLLLPWGHKAGFAAMALLSVAATGLLIQRPLRARTTPADGNVPAAGHAVVALALLAGTVLGAGAEQSLWAFSERLGLAAGVQPQWTGAVLSLATLAGLAGAALAAGIGTRYGRVRTMVVGMAAVAVMRWTVVQVDSPEGYALSQAAWGFAFFFSLPYLAGTAAVLDRWGRWTTATVGASTLGYGLGPLLGGQVAAVGGLPALGPAVGMLSVAALVLVVPAARRAAQLENMPTSKNTLTDGARFRE